MHSSRRTVAAFALVAVLATALWPLLGAVRDSLAGEAQPLCHQAGMMVAADSMPMPGEDGAPAPREQHCPLCILAFFGAHAPAAAVPSYVAVAGLEAAIAEPAPLARRSAVALPQSRAPPESLAA